MMRRPSLAAKRSSRTLPTDFSEREWPCWSALVESPSSSRTPSFWAMAPMTPRSVRRPSTGVRSSFQSPVWRIVPCGVWNAVAKPWGTEWVTGMNSQSNGPNCPALVVLDHDHLGAVHEAGLVDAVGGEAEGERRADDRERQLPEQEGQGAVVVLVAVGDDAADDVVAALDQPGEVGEDEVDAQHVGLGEHQPAVEEHDLAVDLDGGAVAADLAEPAEEGDGNGAGHQMGYPRSARTERGGSGGALGRRAEREAAVADGDAEHAHRDLDGLGEHARVAVHELVARAGAGR